MFWDLHFVFIHKYTSSKIAFNLLDSIYNYTFYRIFQGGIFKEYFQNLFPTKRSGKVLFSAFRRIKRSGKDISNEASYISLKDFEEPVAKNLHERDLQECLLFHIALDVFFFI